MPDEVERCYRVSRQEQKLGEEGFRVHNCLGSYIHLHFGSNGEIARGLAERFPTRFKSPRDALTRVGELSEKYSRRG